MESVGSLIAPQLQEETGYCARGATAEENARRLDRGQEESPSLLRARKLRPVLMGSHRLGLRSSNLCIQPNTSPWK